MIQKDFALKAATIARNYPEITGLAVAGSWIDDEMDEYSDLDLVLVTEQKAGGDKEQMMKYAERFGDLIAGFTGEHVGEPRLLICLYDNPLLHVDIKFVTIEEFAVRVENPAILFERDNRLTRIIQNTEAHWPEPDLQWIEDRFWVWIHYACMKIGRGELMEAYDFLSFLRQTVLAPLLQLKSKKKMRGVRKVETQLSPADLENLKITIAQYNKGAIIKALDNCIGIYRTVRRNLFSDAIRLQTITETKVMAHFRQLKQKNLR